MMPIRKHTTATTAFTLMSASACQSTLSPVTSQRRKRAARVSPTAGATDQPLLLRPRCCSTVAMALASPLLDNDLADHHVVADPAELVADDPEVARLVGHDLEPVVVAGVDLEVGVYGIGAE